MSHFEVDIRKRVGTPRRFFDLHVTFATRGRRTVIYGPSGSGKSLTLQALAGLLRPDSGHIRFGGETLFDSRAGADVPARARGFGYLFQDHALFPHLDVRQNVAFGLKHEGWGWRNPSPRLRHEAVERWLSAFGLQEVAHQHPVDLSGGQRQRTALARALVNSPRALLLDEPFSALDPALRLTLRRELDQLLTRLDIPVLMITHDPEDLPWFGAQTLQLREGVLVEEGAAPQGPVPRLREVKASPGG